MIGYGIETLTFEEPLAVEIPACIETVAACCWVGFRLVPSPQPSLENVVTGCSRLPQFRDAKRSQLRREMRWHFRAAKVTAYGATHSVRSWRARWETDEALRRSIKAHPAFAKWHAGLLESYRKQPLVALATEGSRACYGAFGGDREKLGAMHGFMEEGGI
jgi:hypothetical protein